MVIYSQDNVQLREVCLCESCWNSLSSVLFLPRGIFGGKRLSNHHHCVNSYLCPSAFITTHIQWNTINFQISTTWLSTTWLSTSWLSANLGRLGLEGSLPHKLENVQSYASYPNLLIPGCRFHGITGQSEQIAQVLELEGYPLPIRARTPRFLISVFQDRKVDVYAPCPLGSEGTVFRTHGMCA